MSTVISPAVNVPSTIVAKPVTPWVDADVVRRSPGSTSSNVNPAEVELLPGRLVTCHSPSIAVDAADTSSDEMPSVFTPLPMNRFINNGTMATTTATTIKMDTAIMRILRFFAFASALVTTWTSPQPFKLPGQVY